MRHLILSRCVPVLVALAVTAGLPAQMVVKGTVYNETTGQPQAGVSLSLVSFEGGMKPLEDVFSGPDGSFVFVKTLPGSSRQPMLGMVRAEYEGIPYSTLIRAGQDAGTLRVAVYALEEKQLPTPSAHVVIFEPGAGEMVVNESFMFTNETDPPRAYRNPERGTLRFYLPPEAKGVVQVSMSGAMGMPLRSSATKTAQDNVYMVDAPIKPGENRIDISYLVPHASGDSFTGRLLYKGVTSRLAVPAAVTLDGEGLESMGREPRTQAWLFQTSAVESYTVTISGEGSMRPPESASTTGEERGGMRVAAAPLAQELYWLLGLIGAVLAVGFAYLYTAKPALAAEPAAAGTAARTGAGRPKGSARSRRRKS